MVTRFNADINKVYFVNTYSLFIIESGKGGIQIDFKSYYDWQDKAIYLSKGQYIKFLSDDFVVRRIEFPDEAIFRAEDHRVLFKHLISVGYINFKECVDCDDYLKNSISPQSIDKIIDVSTDQWYWQNPFKADKEEYQIIFDVKEVVDQEYKSNISTHNLTDVVDGRGCNVQSLVRNKLGVNIGSLVQRKKLQEGQKEVAFTDKSIKEIAYDQGYKDPAYFNRIFKHRLGQTPKQFRNNFDFANRDLFTQDILSLLKTFHKQEHQLGFYADQMNMSLKALSKKVKLKMSKSLGQLIRQEIIMSAKELLRDGQLVVEVADQLGFEEANHFSTFFKHHTGNTPSKYLQLKVQ